MRRYLADLGEFFEAFVKNWTALAAGSVGLGVGVFAANHWISSVYAWMVPVAALFASFNVWRAERIRATTLAERLKPKLEILFEKGIIPYEQNDVTNGERYLLYRVAVENTGGQSISDVQLVLDRVEPDGYPFANVSLQVMHGESGPLHPTKKRFYDVVDQSVAWRARVCAQSAHLQRKLETGDYVFHINAHGKDTAASRKFEIKVPIVGEKLLFSPSDAEVEPRLSLVD